MSQPRNRLIFQIVLAFAVITFVGVALIPVISALNNPKSVSGSPTSMSNNAAPVSEQTSNLEDQIRGYEALLQKDPENQADLEGLLEARLRLLSQKKRGEIKTSDIQAVIEPLTKLVKLNPQQTKFAVLLAQAKEQIGDKEGAAQVYRSILTTKPGDMNALQGMVRLQLDQHRPEAAIGLLQDTLSKAASANSIQPHTIDVVGVQVLLSNVYGFQKNYAPAASVLDQAIKQNSQDFRPVLAKAMLLKEQGHNEAAKPLFASALSLAPSQYKDQINKLAEFSPDKTNTLSQPSPDSTDSQAKDKL